jgi:hypothetical protein
MSCSMLQLCWLGGTPLHFNFVMSTLSLKTFFCFIILMVTYQLSIAEGYFKVLRYGMTPHFPLLMSHTEVQQRRTLIKRH